jgi:hypothetical protein
MQVVTVTFKISEETLLEAFKNAGDEFNLYLKEDLDMNKLVEEFSDDVCNFIVNQLQEFVEEGINQDCYLDHFNEED